MPTRIKNHLLFLIAKSTQKVLAHQIEYLHAENQVLRELLPKKPNLSAEQKQRLIKAGTPLGTDLKRLIGIVCYSTFLRWLRGDVKGTPPKSCGRPPTNEEIRNLIIKFARENEWGFDRIVGELGKLKIKISDSTVKRILEEHGFPTAPKRNGNWSEFVKRHADTLWASDFVSKRILTKIGFMDCFALFAIHVASRRVHLVGVTTKPTAAWMAQQARNLRMHFDEQPLKPTHFIHDRDGKFTPQFDSILSSEGGPEIKKLPPRSPNMNAFAERWVRSFRTECLDHFIIFGEGHMRHIAEEFIAHYNEERPHQGKGNKVLAMSAHEISANGPIACKTRLGGMLKHYFRQAA